MRPTRLLPARPDTSPSKEMEHRTLNDGDTGQNTRLATKRHLRSALAIAAVMMGVIGVVGSPPAARAVVAGANGRIVFTRETCHRTCLWYLVTATPRDAGEHIVAGPYTRDAFDDHFIANWSPDGSKLVFMVNQGIWMINADGTGLHEVFHTDGNPGVDDGPSFTPDGRRIIFTRCCPAGYGYSLWAMRTDGTDLTDLTVEPFVDGDGPADVHPQVSPDGTTVAFDRCTPDLPCAIATVAIGGGPVHELTDPSQVEAGHANWAPDGTHIVFTLTGSDGTANIARMRADGGGLTLLTHNRVWKNSPAKWASLDPCYSPDGKRIMFAHRTATTPVPDLFTMNPDGSGVQQVTRTPSRENNPEWSAQRR